jgi:hypothetical protein
METMTPETEPKQPATEASVLQALLDEARWSLAHKRTQEATMLIDAYCRLRIPYLPQGLLSGAAIAEGG